jgi:hypothetical protein
VLPHKTDWFFEDGRLRTDYGEAFGLYRSAFYLVASRGLQNHQNKDRAQFVGLLEFVGLEKALCNPQMQRIH